MNATNNQSRPLSFTLVFNTTPKAIPTLKVVDDHRNYKFYNNSNSNVWNRCQISAFNSSQEKPNATEDDTKGLFDYSTRHSIGLRLPSLQFKAVNHFLELNVTENGSNFYICLLYTSPSPRDS
eukprot:TRINITY_DN8196_c0_g1_i3.p1 TRINITY_DN8196_c0_g1~~TRINITY_DN8196_c0_g1_i3.p1  ORF type:complete len:123 (-),score=22.31 TRINITY_DN8196_c0_g1_i3:37-405(-)